MLAFINNLLKRKAMSTKLNAYIGFKDNAREAMEFYKSVFGGKLTINTFAEFHASEDPAEANNIMHSVLETDNGLTIMASDTPNRMEYTPGARISLSLSGDNDEELTGYFEKLSAGGTIEQPLTAAQWGDKFGMFKDKFEIRWMVNITAKKAA